MDSDWIGLYNHNIKELDRMVAQIETEEDDTVRLSLYNEAAIVAHALAKLDCKFYKQCKRLCYDGLALAQSLPIEVAFSCKTVFSETLTSVDKEDYYLDIIAHNYTHDVFTVFDLYKWLSKFIGEKGGNGEVWAENGSGKSNTMGGVFPLNSIDIIMEDEAYEVANG